MESNKNQQKKINDTHRKTKSSKKKLKRRNKHERNERTRKKYDSMNEVSVTLFAPFLHSLFWLMYDIAVGKYIPDSCDVIMNLFAQKPILHRLYFIVIFLLIFIRLLLDWHSFLVFISNHCSIFLMLIFVWHQTENFLISISINAINETISKYLKRFQHLNVVENWRFIFLFSVCSCFWVHWWQNV